MTARGPQEDGARALSAALGLLEGKVIGDRLSRHRHREFFRFLRRIDAETPPTLDLHLIVDRDGAHRHPRVKSWIRRHPRFNLHVVTASNSWLSLVQSRFRALGNAREFVLAIRRYLGNRNQNPRVFAWTGKGPGFHAVSEAL